MNPIRGAVVFTVALLGIGTARPANAQTSLGASIGMFLPGASLIREIGGVNGGPVPYPIFEKWQVGAAIITAHVTHRLNPRLGIEAKLAHSPGSITSRDSLNQVSHGPGYVQMAGARMPILLGRAGTGLDVHLAPGFAFVHRGGSAWSGFGGRTDPSAVLALSFGGLFGRRSRFSSRVEVAAHMSYAQFSSPIFTSTSRRLVRELMLTFGFDYRLTRRVSN